MRRPTPASPKPLPRLSPGAREQWLRLALQAAGLALWDWDVPSGRVRFSRVADHDGPVPARSGFPVYFEIDASDWSRNTHPDDVPRWEPVVQRVLDGPGDTFTTVYRRRGATEGSWEWVEARGRVVRRNRAGRAIRLVGTYGRTTEAVQAEADRRQREIDLEQAIRLSSVAEVASTLGHEINQPLTAAMSDVQAAQRDLLAPGRGRQARATALLQRTIVHIERAAAIIREQRRAIRPSTSGQQAVDVGRCMEQIRTVFDADARRAGVSLDVLPARGPCTVIGNRTRIEQVLVNLVRNALDAASAGRQGSRRVTLSAKRTRAAVQLRVTDTGPGVRADVRASLFTPYVTTKPDGTGLGLPLSRSIVEAHGGRLVLERTRPGRTTFLAELPRASARQQP